MRKPVSASEAAADTGRAELPDDPLVTGLAEAFARDDARDRRAGIAPD